METIVENKINIAKIKEDIKAKAELQKFYKNQRKTEKIVGERKMQAWEATSKHSWNRYELRTLYAAYGIARGKSFSQIENKYTEENHPLKGYQREIDKILEKYKQPIETQIQ